MRTFKEKVAADPFCNYMKKKDGDYIASLESLHKLPKWHPKRIFRKLPPLPKFKNGDKVVMTAEGQYLEPRFEKGKAYTIRTAFLAKSASFWFVRVDEIPGSNPEYCFTLQ